MLLDAFTGAARRLLQKPLAALVAVTSLALATAALIAVLAVYHGVLLEQLPYPAAERLVQVAELSPTGTPMPIAGPNLDDLIARHRGFAAVARYNGTEVAVSNGERAARTGTYGVSADFFRVLGVAPIQGRAFSVDMHREAPAAVALVSPQVRDALFGVDAAVDGQRLRAFGQDYDVIGVMPPGFAFPAGAGVWIAAETWGSSSSRTAHNWQAIARLESDVPLAQAQADAGAIGAAIRAEHGDGEVNLAAFELTPLREQLTAAVRPTLLALLVAAGLLLAAAASSTANLAIARHLARRPELALRHALGARRGRLLLDALAEGVLLGALAAALGALLGALGLGLLLSSDGLQLPRADGLRLDWLPLSAGIALALLTAIAVNLLPLLGGRATRLDALHAVGARSSGDRGSQRARRGLLIGQVAFAMLLLVSAGLLARSFAKLAATEPGFVASGAVISELALGAETPAAAAERNQALQGAIRRLPGITAVGIVNAAPMSGRGANGRFEIVAGEDRSGYGEYRVASPGYRAALGLPLMRGRDFELRDDAAAPHVGLISAASAERFWPGEDPLGQQIRFGNMDGDPTPITIVGIVGDLRDRGLAHDAPAMVYLPLAQRPQRATEFALVVRGELPLAALQQAVAGELARQLPGQPLRVRALAELVGDDLAFRRSTLLLFGLLGGMAVLLALAGVYSLTVFLLRERHRELAVRLSLGAAPAALLRLLLAQGARLHLAGIVLGILLALVLSHLLAALLHDVSAHDPLSYLGAAGVLALSALLACWLPARRVSRIQPMHALRNE
jgi:putative ABC transport system permease protein